MAKKSTVASDEDAVADAREAFNRAAEAESHNRETALDDLQFGRLGEQWPERIRRDRELEGRPCLTVNRIPAHVRQVVNDARQNKPAIAIHPVDSGSDPETAEILTGLVRHIEQSSDAEVAYDTALESAVSGGFGYYGINTRYATDDGFEQDIVIEPKPNPLAIYGDPDSTAADSADWNSAFELGSFTKEAFENRWDGADPVSFEGQGIAKPACAGETVQVAYRWEREEIRRKIVAVGPPRDMNDPRAGEAMELTGERMIMDLADYEARKALFDALGMTIVGAPREVPSHKVTQRIYSGADELETIDWAGKYIPLVPVYGEMLNIEGKRYFRSMFHDAKDSQRMVNYWRTTTTELVALAPKTPFIGKTGQFVTDAAKWQTANSQNHAYIEYDDPEGQTGSMAPQRQPFASIPAGALQEALNASDDMKAIMGMYDASLGARSNETSGKAIMARQREGDVGSFHFIDNLSRAIRHGGRIVLDLIPKVISTPRILRILGPDGDAKEVGVNGARPPQKPIVANSPQAAPGPMDSQMEKAADIARTYDLTVGKYDVTVSAGPSFTSRREEAASQMIELIRAYPAIAPVIGDLLAKNLDWPGADEIAERLKAMLPAQLHGESPEAQQAKAQMEQMAKIIGELKGKLAAAEADQSIDQGKLTVEKYNAETARLRAMAPKGIAMPPEETQMMAIRSIMAIINSPDILEAMNQGAPEEEIMAALAQRMGGAGQPPRQPPEVAAAPDEPRPI